MADIAESGCLILWGYNPFLTRITHATATLSSMDLKRWRPKGDSDPGSEEISWDAALNQIAATMFGVPNAFISLTTKTAESAIAVVEGGD